MTTQFDFRLLVHNVGKSHAAIKLIIEKIQRERIIAACIQESNLEQGVLPIDIQATCDKYQISIVSHRPTGRNSVSILINNRLAKIDRIERSHTCETLLVQLTTLGNNTSIAVITARAPEGVDNLPLHSNKPEVKQRIENTEQLYDQLLYWTIQNTHLPIIIGADLNETLTATDRSPMRQDQRPNEKARQRGFLRPFLKTTKLVDLGARIQGPSRFTWQRGETMSRIDYILSSSQLKETQQMTIEGNIVGKEDHKLLVAHLSIPGAVVDNQKNDTSRKKPKR